MYYGVPSGHNLAAAMTWLLLIYTVPSEPSRKRAAVWRELKRAGAVYLRDGVCALPERDETVHRFRAVADMVEEFGGRATIVAGARLDPCRAEEIVAESIESRQEEYRENGREAERFLTHIAREHEHRVFTETELARWEADLGKLRRWHEQVTARDYFGAEDAEAANDTLARCDEAVAVALDDAYRRAPEGRR